ncbi:MAG: UDP-N-acetylmuramate dehydrogenase [Chitinophagales bacterium]
MTIQENISLKSYNTFQLDCEAQYFVELNELADMDALMKCDIFKNEKHLVLGGGSNMLFTSDRFEGLVIKNNLKGIEVVEENEDHVWLKISAGENWHETVTFCVNNKWGGIENLALIPGCVGAAPIQNIGAYGVELRDVFESALFLNFEDKSLKTYHNSEANFGYRDSIFKNELKGKGIIVAVTLKLKKQPQLNVSYGAIQQTLELKGIVEPQIKDVYQAVIDIRSSKLPDPKVIGNAGSFFKNPELQKDIAEEILFAYPKAPHYVMDEKTIKIPAGWMIEQCGWKGFMDGDIGVHDKQALVLVNKGNGKGEDIKALAFKIQNSVMERFGVMLTPEVNMI